MKDYDMSDEATRRKVCWLLQRLTSYSLWEKKRDAWERFTRAYENAVKTWPGSQPEQVEADRLTSIYNILSLYEKGMDELAKGRRHVWRNGQPFNETWKGSALTRTNLYRHPSYWERGIQLEPWPPKIEELHQVLIQSFYKGDQSPLEVLPQQPVPTAKWSIAYPLLDPQAYDEGFYTLPYPVFPDPLPDLPEASDVLITSGDTVPADGIWEPVRNRQVRLLGIIPVGEKVYENNGCFNYFVKDTTAPRISGDYNESTERTEYERTQWRLLWEDTRYKDGVIPDESEYFLRPPVENASRTEGSNHDKR
jgi:hypothetical protein